MQRPLRCIPLPSLKRLFGGANDPSSLPRCTNWSCPPSPPSPRRHVIYIVTKTSPPSNDDDDDDDDDDDSERLSLSGSEGKRLYETQNINLSLSSLGDVLACLSKNATILARRQLSGNGDAGAGGGEAVAPVPYRNSKLTHFLKVRLLFSCDT